jgi:carbohydrate kinase (thermoresistant glucokinase family)
MTSKVIILMGVTGSGKTTIGRLLGHRMHLPFIDADDYHPESNIIKMRSGEPLDDKDRQGWLLRLVRIIKQHQSSGLILGCSALKSDYRHLLDPNHAYLWVYLKVDKETVEKRLENRKGHFMPASLIDSQFETLEEPKDAVTIDASHSIEKVIDHIQQHIG